MKIEDIVYVFRMKSEKELAWHERYHTHSENKFELHYFLEGKGTFLNNKTVNIIKSGQLFITPPGRFHSITHSDISQPISYYAILFDINDDDTNLLKLLNSKKLNKELATLIGSKHRFFFEELKEKYLSDNYNRNQSAKYKLISFLYDLTENSSTFSSINASRIHIEKALGIMQKSLFNRFQLCDLCQELDLSEEYFIRLFKKQLKITPMKYFLKLKIEASTGILSTSNKSIKEISDLLGFANQFHFARTFKKQTGKTPSEYRALNKSKTNYILSEQAN